MKQRITEEIKVDIGLVAQALNNTNATGKYHPIKDYAAIAAILSGGAMAATKTSKIELLQASDYAGTGSKVIPAGGQLATAEITANTLVTEMTITLATFLATGTITINGLVFTAHATVTTVADREFSISGADTADAVELCVCINDPTYGVPGVTATSALGVITLVATEPGETLITVTSAPDDGTCVKATTKAQAYVEIDTRKIDKKNGFDYVAIKITTTANSNVAAALLRGNARYSPDQKVGASATI